MNPPKILAFSGSPSRRSLNSRFVRVAMAGAEAAGASVTYVELADFELPIFSVDLEDRIGMHENARAFKKLMMEHGGFLIASPEYNGSVTGALKNLIDWVSRGSDGNSGHAAFHNKYGAFLSASPGAFGGVRSIDHARYLFGRLGVTVIPQMFPLGNATKVIDEDGNVEDDKIRDSAEAIGKALCERMLAG